MPIIALLTDYGTKDHYVAAVKGVILGIYPEVRIVDVTHEIPPFGIADAAFVLRQAWIWFPEGTVFVAVVDPGVGSSRRLLLAGFAGRLLVAPDNGLLTWLHHDFGPEFIRAIEDRRFGLPLESDTFHGRDILAPVAAHLASGVRPEAVGPIAKEAVLLPVPRRAQADGDGWTGRIIYVDHFGTLVSNVHREQISQAAPSPDGWRVEVNGQEVGPVRRAFHEARPGTPIAYLGSTDFLEIAVSQGSAASRFGTIDAIRLTVR